MKRTLLIPLFLFLVSPVLAQDASKPEPRSITVTGNAERILPADQVRISASLRSVRGELAAARTASQEGFSAVIKGLGELGVPAEKSTVRTASASTRDSSASGSSSSNSTTRACSNWFMEASPKTPRSR
jgi:uncharacterized protein YggE